MSSRFIKINNSQVYSVPIKDAGENLVELLEKCPEIYVDQTRKYSQTISKSVSLVRKTVADKLIKVQKSLPNNLRLMIIEVFRPLEVQRILFNNYQDRLGKDHPDWDQKRLELEASFFVAPPENTPPHSTGGAVDLTLITNDCQELDLGGGLTGNYSEKCYTDSPNISDVARKNRQILIMAMTAQGFVNYPAEWWHWSYGDRYWAFARKQPYALFSSI